MNRRTLVQSLAIMPMAKHASLGIKLRSLESQFTLNDRVAVQMFLRAYSNSEAAESWRREWVGRAFLGLGEWYLDSTESVELPPELAEMPGALHLHRYTAGVAAVKSSMLVGAFRRDHIACVMRMNGNAEGTMIASEALRFRASAHPIRFGVERCPTSGVHPHHRVTGYSGRSR